MFLPFQQLKPWSVFLRLFLRHSKNDPFVQEVKLLDANPTNAHIKSGDDYMTKYPTRHRV